MVCGLLRAVLLVALLPVSLNPPPPCPYTLPVLIFSYCIYTKLPEPHLNYRNFTKTTGTLTKLPEIQRNYRNFTETIGTSSKLLKLHQNLRNFNKKYQNCYKTIWTSTNSTDLEEVWHLNMAFKWSSRKRECTWNSTKLLEL